MPYSVIFSVTCLAFFFSESVVAQGQQNQAQILQRLLQRFPQADANGDGTLTEQEARAFQQQRRRQQQTSSPEKTPTHANVHYGPHDRQVLDLYLAESRQPTPLIIYIHGGGFVGGDKKSVSARIIQESHKSGISVAAIHYRFVTEVPFPAPQLDAARAVQFLRANSEKYNLDPKRLAAYGGSAGAGLSLWLGFHDDLADPKSADPIARQSTRLVVVGSRGGQTSYDPYVIKKWIGGRAYEHPSIYKCYGITSIDQISDAQLQPLFDEVSAIKHLTKDDPPVHMVYSEADAPLPEDARPGQGIHHPIFGQKLVAAMNDLGIESVYRHTDNFQENTDLDMLEFFKQHLDVE